MLTLKRLAVYLITFLIVLILVIVLVDWKRVDNYIVGVANKTSNQDEIVNKEIVFVNIDKHPYGGSECESFTLYRQSVIKLLNAVAEETKKNNGPKGVVLDIWFSRDNTELENLKAALKQLKDLKVPVYTSYNVIAGYESVDLGSINFDKIDSNHATELYDGYFAGSGGGQSGSGRYHTLFYAEENMASYENDIYLRSELFEDSALIESLPLKVATDLDDSKSTTKPKRQGSIVPYGSIAEMQKRTYTFIPDSVLPIGSFLPPAGSDSSMAAINMDKKILIVGDVVNDVLDIGNATMPGPYILTWALSDLLDENIRLKLPLEGLYVIIGQMLFFAFFVVLIYALIFKYVKQLQTKPTIIAILSFLTGMVFLFIYYKLILTFKAVIPVGQTIAAMLVTAALSWRFAHKFLVTGVAEGSQKYDVFISYSHGQYGDWVIKNVYEPLAAFRKPNGDKLNIFFDKKSIGIGEAFTSKYMWAIVDSKYFIPVITEEYYKKNHCRNELDLAVNRSVEKRILINMIAFSFDAVPEPYRTYNYVDIKADPTFIDTIKAQLSV